MAQGQDHAARPHRAEGTTEPLRMVCFRLAGQRFAIPVAQVAEVIPHRPVTRVPFTPGGVAGIINLRGDVVSVLDLGDVLRLGKTTVGKDTCIVIVRAARRTGGVLVDRIDEMRSFEPTKLEAKPPVGSPRTAGFIAGVVTLAGSDDEAGAPCSVLDMESVFGSEEFLGTEKSDPRAERHEQS